MSGLLLSLGLVYPVFVLLVFRPHPQWFQVDVPNAAVEPGLILPAALVVAALIAVGMWPAVRAGATPWSEGAKAGTLGGVVAALTVFVVILMPLNAWLASLPLFDFAPSSDTLLPPEPFLSTYAQ